MKWLKQLFCSHVWKTDKKEDGGKYSETLTLAGVEYRIRRLKRTIFYRTCVKCGKRTITESFKEITDVK